MDMLLEKTKQGHENIKNTLQKINNSLTHLEQSSIYDVDKYCHSLLHQTEQLEYFYCHLAKNGHYDKTFYHLHDRPSEHQLAYFNIGRGFPKEIMDGHWCYILKDFGCKMLVIPCTSIKKYSKRVHPQFEMDILVQGENDTYTCRLNLTDMRSVDVQRLVQKKPYFNVLESQKKITNFIKKRLFY